MAVKIRGAEDGTVEVIPAGEYINAMLTSVFRIGLAFTVFLYLVTMPIWSLLPWWLPLIAGFAGGVAIALPVYAWHAIPDE